MITPAVNARAQLEDISATGACLRLKEPQRLGDGRLCWLNFEVYARLVWNDGIRCGLVFDDPLSEECLKQTIEFARLSSKNADDRFLKLASAWVHGPGDW